MSLFLFNKKAMPEKYKKIFNTEFYAQVYRGELGGSSPEQHFLENLKTQKYDPNPHYDLEFLCSQHNLSPEEVLNAIAEDEELAHQYKTISKAVYRQFDIEPTKKLNQDLVSSKEFVDEAFYFELYPDVAKTWLPAYQHYSLMGFKEGRNPNANFDTSFYLAENSKIQELGINPLVHYHEFGFAEGRCQNPAEKEEQAQHEALLERIEKAKEFDPVFYLDEYTDCRDAGMDPLVHFTDFGNQELRRPNKLFFPEFYLEQNPDVSESGLLPFSHFVEFGWKEKGRTVIPDDDYIAEYERKKEEEKLAGQSNLADDQEEVATDIVAPEAPQEESTVPPEICFDKDYYYANNPDVAGAGMDPEAHYYGFGEAEGRCPNAYFSPTFYKKLGADVRSAGISPFSHFCDFGFWEGRLAKEPECRASSTSKKPLLFVGHDGIQAGSEVVLLEVIKWFNDHTDRRLKTLLLSPGPMANRYAEISDTYVLPEYSVDIADDLESFLNEDFEFCYINTVVAGHLFTLLEQEGINLNGEVIAHVHEMEKVIRQNQESFDKLTEYAKHYISASPATTDDLANCFDINRDDVTTVPAFIRVLDPVGDQLASMRQESRAELNIPNDAFVVAGCGTVYSRKGPDIFLDAALDVVRQSENTYFVWIGPGPDIDELVERIPKEFAGRIQFVGGKDHANFLLSCADLFFLSSREDPFPLVVMEAAQHSVPSICFGEATGITAFVQDDAGFIIPKIGAEESAKLILDLLNHRELVHQKGSVARSRLVAGYTSEAQCKKIYQVLKNNSDYKPSVTAVVPFYNQETFIESRVNSILDQSIKDIEIILMDDCSPDNTAAELEKYSDSDYRIGRVVINTENSGSTFRQWQKGLALAESDIIWIAEGDDLCDPDFIETLLPYFDDSLVTIASGKTEIIDEHGDLKEGALDPYLNSAYPDKYQQTFINDGFVEVEESLGAMCTLVNASGLLLRKSAVPETELQQATDYKICGDWLVYLGMLKDGKLAYDVSTKNYFRRHSQSVVGRLEGRQQYFDERAAIARYVLSEFSVSERMKRRMESVLKGEWDRFQHFHTDSTQEDVIALNDIFSATKMSAKPKYKIGFYVHGMLFSKGGIERLAADLANHYCKQGHSVVIYCRKWGSDQSVYPLYESVTVSPVFDENALEASVSDLKSELIKDEVDVFIPMLSEWLFGPVVSAAEGTGTVIIASEHNNPWKIEELWWTKEERQDTFAKVDKIHLLTNAYIDSLDEELRSKAMVIPNGVAMSPEVDYSTRQNVILAVGRLAPQKRFDRLIDACFIIQETLRRTGFSIHLYGEGTLKDELVEKVNEYELNDVFKFCGVTNKMDQVMQRSAFYAQASEFEGLSIAAIEALSLGLPVVAFTECIGMDDLVIEGENGYLAEDVKAFAKRIRDLVIDSEARERFSHSSHKLANNFSIENFYAGWDLIVEESMAGNK